MAVNPIITFKAGLCEQDESNPRKFKCSPTPGYLYLYKSDEDEMLHFCWRPRSEPAESPEVDLIMFPGDATFTPYTGKDGSTDSSNITSPTTGRIFRLKFASSGQHDLFWLQSKPQAASPNTFSARDRKLGQIVQKLLDGEDVNIQDEMRSSNEDHGSRGPDEDEDQDMDDAPPAPHNPRLRANSTGGAGADATGGDIRDEGEESREGGADGGRAAAASDQTNASALVQSFLNSLSAPGGTSPAAPPDEIFTTLGDLLTPETCVPVIQSAPDSLLDTLITHLPPAIIILETTSDDEDLSPSQITPAAAEEAAKTLTSSQKKEIITRVLHSPQLHQSLESLTLALRDGGLPTVAEALKVKVKNDGYVRAGGGMPMGGGSAVEAFLRGVEKTVEDEEGRKEGDRMETDA